MHALLIDGLNLIRRVHAGVPDTDNPSLHSEAVKDACVASAYRALRHHRPSHVLCVLDGEESSWRSALFPEYKKNRRPMPDGLRSLIATIVRRFD